MAARASGLLLLAALAALAVAAPAPAAPFHGVVAQGELEPADFQRMGNGGAGTLRQRVSWARIQPVAGGPYSFEWLDGVVGQAAQNGVRVLPSLETPRPGGSQNPPTGKRARAQFASFAAALADRYGRGGDFWLGHPSPLPIVSWQILNEQNGPAYWNARPNPRAYGRIVKAVSRRIRAEDSRAEIVLGGMFGTPSGRGAIDAWNYLKRLYRVPGIKAAFKTVAIHPYSPNLRGISYQAKKVRNVMKTRDRGAKLRVTEFGWGSARRGHPQNVGRKGQARMLRKSIRLFERKRRAWKVVGVNWFAWQDGPAGCGFCSSAGLFTRDRTAKPSWRAFKQVAR